MADLDKMVAFALKDLLSGSDERRGAMVRRMCQRWPEAPALSLVFAITSAAGMIEDNIASTGDEPDLAALAFRMAALVSADVYAVESLGHRPAKARDLAHFWRRVDPAYLAL